MMELLFYGGIALMAGAAAASAVAAVMFHQSKKRISAQMESEYGKKWN